MFALVGWCSPKMVVGLVRFLGWLMHALACAVVAACALASAAAPRAPSQISREASQLEQEACAAGLDPQLQRVFASQYHLLDTLLPLPLAHAGTAPAPAALVLLAAPAVASPRNGGVGEGEVEMLAAAGRRVVAAGPRTALTVAAEGFERRAGHQYRDLVTWLPLDALNQVG